MPELPEVETTVSSLKKKVLKKAFVFTWSESQKKRLTILKGKKIDDISRVGKSIFFHLDDGKKLFIHLKMTGHILVGSWEFSKKEKRWVGEEEIMKEKKNGFIRYMFEFNDGTQMALSDPRKFARVEVIGEKEYREKIKRIGPDPLTLSKQEFVKMFEGKKREIKPLLLDQEFLGGVGNIYASEILFKAKISPKRKSDSLSKKELENIYKATCEILKKSLELKGDSTSDYRLIDGKRGGYQNEHLVYDRKGEKCFKCKKNIKRIVVGSRGTYYCPNCQK